MLQLEHIDYLWGLCILVPLVVLFVAVLHWKAKSKDKLGKAAIVQKLIENYHPGKYRLKVVLVLAAIALLTLAVSNPRKPMQSSMTKSNGIDVVIALDVSKSMLSIDEKPTRLDKAKQLMYALCEGLENNRIGVVLFAGEAFVQLPLTNDAAVAKMYISNANTDAIPIQGTMFNDALHTCAKAFNTKEKTSKAILLITDGEDHDNKANDAAQQLHEAGIKLYTIGIGSKEGAPIVEAGTADYKRDKNGQTIISKLNEPLLQQIASTADGQYFHLQSGTIEQVLQALNKLEKQPISSFGSSVVYQTYYGWFVLAAILLLAAELLITERRKRLKTIS